MDSNFDDSSHIKISQIAHTTTFVPSSNFKISRMKYNNLAKFKSTSNLLNDSKNESSFAKLQIESSLPKIRKKSLFFQENTLKNIPEEIPTEKIIIQEEIQGRNTISQVGSKRKHNKSVVIEKSLNETFILKEEIGRLIKECTKLEETAK